MQYLGGKSRLAKTLATEMLRSTSDRRLYVEPFIGGGSVLCQMAPAFDCVIGADKCEDLMLLWQALKDGWEPPDRVSEDEYRRLRTAAPSAVRGFAKYACSFGGRPWEGYARNSRTDYAGAGKRSLLKKAAFLSNVQLCCGDYSELTDIVISQRPLVYADPPYINTKGYGERFDHSRFWKVMESWAASGASVFVSEKVAPDHWRPVVEIKRRLTVSGTKDYMVEYLFSRD